MASYVDISNAALAHLGDSATVSSIDPPEGSAQAQHCARFMPMARDALLEMHPWSFSTKRVALQLLNESSPIWLYTYAVPSDLLNALAVIDSTAQDDYTNIVTPAFNTPYTSANQVGNYTPQPYVLETDSSGADILLTNLPNAWLRYTAYVNDPTKFSPLFTRALEWLLASYLGGPLIKGDSGRQATSDAYKMFYSIFKEGVESDANQRRTTSPQVVQWIADR